MSGNLPFISQALKNGCQSMYSRSSSTSGELAKAAFQHGYEAYGVDILDRLATIVEQRGGSKA